MVFAIIYINYWEKYNSNLYVLYRFLCAWIDNLVELFVNCQIRTWNAHEITSMYLSYK